MGFESSGRLTLSRYYTLLFGLLRSLSVLVASGSYFSDIPPAAFLLPSDDHFCAPACCWPCAKLILCVQVCPGVPSPREAYCGVLAASLRQAHACRHPRRSTGPGRCQLLLVVFSPCAGDVAREPRGVAKAPACFDCVSWTLASCHDSCVRSALQDRCLREQGRRAEAFSDIFFHPLGL